MFLMMVQRVSLSHYAASLRFHQAALAPLGLQPDEVEPGVFWIGNFNQFFDNTALRTRWFVRPPIDLCYRAPDDAAVDAFHAAGLAAGGRDAGSPAPCPSRPCVYAATLLDPDGNTVIASSWDDASMEAAYHAELIQRIRELTAGTAGAATRSDDISRET